VQLDQDDLVSEMNSYRAFLAIRERLAQSDPCNAGWQSDLSTAYQNVGDVQLAQSDLAGALKSYGDSLAIMQRLARSDPGNAEWQRDLSTAYENVGKVQVAQGDLVGALKSYRDSLAIRERLVALDPANKQWHDNLADTVAGLGGLAFKLVLAHDMTNALAAADQSIALAADQIWLYTNRAHALMFLGRTDEARALYLKYRGQKDASSDGKPWEVVILGDFAEFRKAGLTNPLMDEIETLFTSTG
jgi:tetratricopeptide (TPR) repeat protein